MSSIHSAFAPASERAKLLPGYERLCARLVYAVVAVTLFIGGSNLVVWMSPELHFIAEWPGMMVMRLNTALSLIAGALSLLMFQANGGRRNGGGKVLVEWVARIFAVVPLLIGGLTSLQYVLGVSLGIDELVMPGTFPGDRANVAVVSPGRMSMNASLSFFLLGLALTILDLRVERRDRRPLYLAPILAVLSALPACFGLVGYLLGQGGFTGILKSTNILFHVAASLMLLTMGTLLVRPLRQPVVGLFSSGAEGVLLRWLLPGSATVLLVLAWLIGRGRKMGMVAPGEGAALMLFGGLVLLFMLIIAASRAVREQEATADRASQAKDDFLAALSHELRTPLTPVLLSASHLRQDPRLPADVRDELAMIERNVSLEARLIDDLLDLTRIAKGKLEVRSELCDVHDLLGHALEIVREEASRQQLSVDVELRAKRCAIVGDAARLQQVFWNLLKNAVKFTPREGHVQVRSWDGEEDDSLMIEIRDTGMGFSGEVKERLFMPFEQGQLRGSHQFGGLGLGLAIARVIVDLHDGEIEAHSEGRGLGASFIVRLPNARVLERVSAKESRGPNLKAESREVVEPQMRILLVEDDEGTRKILVQLLERAGHHVLAAGSVADALATAHGNQFEIVISDLGLPDGSGLELLPQLRALTPGLKAVALSGYGMEEDLRKSSQAGFMMHLVKPLKFAQLAQALQQIRSMPNGTSVSNR